ncbi:protein MpDIR31 [Marchantia polymorpha subsp. ruderalis]|uniref:Dirigent protein n=2 Tax=Marchantia polymorpha TaxID=3197 RepID=A0AAF6B6W2_MARPO|nr:hypothetical protein MARPO_0114s0039 [Marchantia polymorpha]BBN07746.1 hypothetical protein Mp_4g06150 [Marchantia polymorpha subsp. ruderalis]|eukprot:PTQ31227.1 hypothetical protein MARPO_0114s0039 [Marchantia polymorpha]
MVDTKVLLFACCLLLGSGVVQASKSYKFEFYQHMIEEVDTPTVFGPKTGFVGTGYVFNNPATVGQSISSRSIGRVSGLYFFSSEWVAENYNTVYFNATAGEFFSGEGTLYLRGLWFIYESSDPRGDYQELAIVGGTQKLRGAQGHVEFEKIHIPGSDALLFKVICHVSLPEKESEYTYIQL